jgi:cobaltochelatase CobS
MIATANTIGKGANAQYVGRLVADGATLDRFVMITWDYDNKLEAMISGDAFVTSRVIELRKAAEAAGLGCIISPRASINTCKLVASGMDIEKALEYTIFNKLTPNERSILCQ